MENGGNAKINAIFEAKLAQSGRKKPTNLADGPTRERYIRDKYERRKFYDPAGFAMQSNVGGTPVRHSASGGGDFSSPSRPGAPSDVARRRVASRQARMKPPTSTPIAKAPPVKVAQAPVSAPVEFDLLDFGSDNTATATKTTSVENSGDAFSLKPVVSTASGVPNSAILPPPKTAPPAATSTTLSDELLKNPAPTTRTTTSNNDIMALFGPSKQQQQNQQAFGFGMQAMNQMAPNTSQQQSNMMGFNNQQNMMAQQQRQQMMMMQNNNMMNGNQMMSNQMMPNQMMSNQMMPNQMIQQQMKQQQMMMQKQMMMQQQMTGSMNNMGMYGSSANNGNNNFFGVSNGNNMNQTIQGMQNMTLGNGATRQSSDDGGFGTPMGGGSQQQSMKSDAFSSLGGMNAFR